MPSLGDNSIPGFLTEHTERHGGFDIVLGRIAEQGNCAVDRRIRQHVEKSMVTSPRLGRIPVCDRECPGSGAN